MTNLRRANPERSLIGLDKLLFARTAELQGERPFEYVEQFLLLGVSVIPDFLSLVKVPDLGSDVSALERLVDRTHVEIRGSSSFSERSTSGTSSVSATPCSMSVTTTIQRTNNVTLFMTSVRTESSGVVVYHQPKQGRE